MEYDHILAATDFSKLGDLAVSRACGLADAGAVSLTLLHVLPTPEAPSPIFAHYEVGLPKSKLDEAKAKAREMLEARVPDALREKEIEVRFEVRVGDPASEILACGVEHEPDLIVLATHGRRGWRRWVMGSVAERIVQMAQADVLAIRERDEEYAEDD